MMMDIGSIKYPIRFTFEIIKKSNRFMDGFE